MRLIFLVLLFSGCVSRTSAVIDVPPPVRDQVELLLWITSACTVLAFILGIAAFVVPVYRKQALAAALACVIAAVFAEGLAEWWWLAQWVFISGIAATGLVAMLLLRRSHIALKLTTELYDMAENGILPTSAKLATKVQQQDKGVHKLTQAIRGKK